MLRPLILVTEYLNDRPTCITKIVAKTPDTAKERVKNEVKALQEKYPNAKVSTNALQVATVEIDRKQRVKIEIVERF